MGYLNKLYFIKNILLWRCRRERALHAWPYSSPNALRRSRHRGKSFPRRNPQRGDRQIAAYRAGAKVGIGVITLTVTSPASGRGPRA